MESLRHSGSPSPGAHLLNSSGPYLTFRSKPVVTGLWGSYDFPEVLGSTQDLFPADGLASYLQAYRDLQAQLGCSYE